MTVILRKGYILKYGFLPTASTLRIGCQFFRHIVKREYADRAVVPGQDILWARSTFAIASLITPLIK